MRTQYYKHKIENLLVINKIVTIHYLEFDKDYVGKEEFHDFWELVYVDKGEAVATANGKEYTLRAGEAIFHQPNERHALRANGRLAPNVIIVSFTTKSESVGFFTEKRITLDKRLLPFMYTIIDESKKTFDLPYSDPALKKMPLLEKPTLGGRQLIKNLLEVLLINIMRDETETRSENTTFLPKEEMESQVAKRVMAYLQEHIRDDIQIADLCHALHYNKSHLFAQFKRATGRSIMSYFTLLKIDAAKKDLRQSDMSVAQIAALYAFDSPNYFSKTFKKYTRYTPTSYRKIHKAKK
ncbi:MAG: helix-turn-helix domain-containing protein [Clostridia bacterium]|nr:helix-turn-helix domain-containing protein [Clostridia bacterium]